MHAQLVLVTITCPPGIRRGPASAVFLQVSKLRVDEQSNSKCLLRSPGWLAPFHPPDAECSCVRRSPGQQENICDAHPGIIRMEIYVRRKQDDAISHLLSLTLDKFDAYYNVIGNWYGEDWPPGEEDYPHRQDHGDSFHAVPFEVDAGFLQSSLRSLPSLKGVPLPRSGMQVETPTREMELKCQVYAVDQKRVRWHKWLAHCDWCIHGYAYTECQYCREGSTAGRETDEEGKAAIVNGAWAPLCIGQHGIHRRSEPSEIEECHLYYEFLFDLAWENFLCDPEDLEFEIDHHFEMGGCDACDGCMDLLYSCGGTSKFGLQDLWSVLQLSLRWVGASSLDLPIGALIRFMRSAPSRRLAQC